MENAHASSENMEIPRVLFIIVAEHHRQFDKESFKLNIGISRFNVSLRFYFLFMSTMKQSILLLVFLQKLKFV